MTMSPVTSATTNGAVTSTAATGAARPAQPAGGGAPPQSPAASVWERQTFSALLETAVAAVAPGGGDAAATAFAGSAILGQPASQAPPSVAAAATGAAASAEASIASLAQAAIEAALTLREHPLAAAPAIALRVGGALAGTTLWLSRRGDGWGLSVEDAHREQRQLLGEGEKQLAARFESAGLGSLKLEFYE